MDNLEASAVIQRLIDAMEGQLAALRARTKGLDASHRDEKPTMVVMRTPEMEALRYGLVMIKAMDNLHTFAEIHEGSEDAADALMRWLVGKCDHDFEHEGICELCGRRLPV